jgi:hypothetical protein
MYVYLLTHATATCSVYCVCYRVHELERETESLHTTVLELRKQQQKAADEQV